ncbi:uncharacterized protein METZ01_LOCUS96610 [marine metagenome]|uniref:Uncharacterized protein n=1 Tax=marine metagenome TaxID=408172 RepID=A0A381VTX2_9ZZZZ
MLAGLAYVYFWPNQKNYQNVLKATYD